MRWVGLPCVQVWHLVSFIPYPNKPIGAGSGGTVYPVSLLHSDMDPPPPLVAKCMRLKAKYGRVQYDEYLHEFYFTYRMACVGVGPDIPRQLAFFCTNSIHQGETLNSVDIGLTPHKLVDPWYIIVMKQYSYSLHDYLKTIITQTLHYQQGWNIEKKRMTLQQNMQQEMVPSLERLIEQRLETMFNIGSMVFRSETR